MRKIPFDVLKERAIKIHGNRYEYLGSFIKNRKSWLKINCKIHGPFEQTIINHISNKRNCSKCVGGVLVTKEEFILKANKKHKNKYDYSKVIYKNCKTKICIICPKHGEFYQTPDKHMMGGCDACGGSKTLTLEEFIEKSNIIHNNYYNYDLADYKCSAKKIIIICPKHKEFKQSPGAHLVGKGCKHCARGNSSKKEQLWLDKIGLPKTDEYRGVVLRVSGKIIKPDGFIPGSNIIFEFLGDFWHGHPVNYSVKKLSKKYKISFKDRFSKTVERIRFLRANGYKVICIWESVFDRKLNEKRIKKIFVNC